MRAYIKLETKRTELDRNMRHGFVNLSGKLRNKVQRGDLTTVGARELKADANVSQLLQMAKEECEKFIENDEEKDTLLQWHDKTIAHLKKYFEQSVEEAARKANFYIKTKEGKKRVKKVVENYEKEIIKRTKELAQESKGSVDEAKGRKLFDDMFEKYLEEFKKSTPEPCRVDVEHDAQASLRACFSNAPGIESKVLEIGKESEFCDNIFTHIAAQGIRVVRSPYAWNENQHFRLYIKRTCENLVQMVMAFIDEQTESDYSKDWFETIIGNVLKEVGRINTTLTDKRFELQNEFCFDALLHIFCLSVPRFKKIHEEFMRINHPENLLREKRDDIYQYFTTAYGCVESMVSITNNKSVKIMRGYQERMLDKIFLNVANGTTAVPALNGNKSNLEVHILIDMAAREKFEDLMLYIRNPRKYYERFIHLLVDEYCGTGDSSRLNKIINSAVKHYHKEVTKCMEESTEDVKNTRGDVDAWLDVLYKRISDNVPFTVDELKKNVTEEMQSKLELFQNAMLTAWGNVDKKAYTDNIYSKERESIVRRVVEDVMNDMCGCLEQCPFCGAVCCCTQVGHQGDHSVLFHRPQAIGGRMLYLCGEAVLETCSSAVKTENTFQCHIDTGYQAIMYKEYKTAGWPHSMWSIVPDDSSQKYWKWIVCRFSNELESEYGYKFEEEGKIPDEWKRITKEEAIASVM